MCSKFIQLLFFNKNDNLYITGFNSDWTLNNVKLDPDIDSMRYVDKDKVHLYSDSVIYLVSELTPFLNLYF